MYFFISKVKISLQMLIFPPMTLPNCPLFPTMVLLEDKYWDIAAYHLDDLKNTIF